MKRTSKGQAVRLQTQKQKDEKVASLIDSKIVYPFNLQGKTFASWPKFWNQLNADRDNYMYWYRLQKLGEYCQKTKKNSFQVKCRMCKSKIQIQVSGQKHQEGHLKVVSVNNIHNHSKFCLENDQALKKQNQAQRLNQMSDIFLVNNSYQAFKVYQPYELTCFRISDLQDVQIYTSSENNKKSFVYSSSYTFEVDGAKIGQRLFTFPPKTKKELDLLAIAFALCDCYYLEIPNAKIICSIECSKLCRNSWQSSILQAKLDQFSMGKFKIIKELESKLGKVQFVAQQQEALNKKNKPKQQINTWKNEQYSNPEQKVEKKDQQRIFLNIAPNPDEQKQNDSLDFLRQLQDISN